MSKSVMVDLHSLIIGRELCFPIHDVNGVLLLAAGQPFTRERKLRIIERGLNRVVLDETDVENATLCAKPSDHDSAAGGEFNDRIAAKLESLIRSGKLSLSNTGPSVRKSVVLHGSAPYDEQQRAALIEQQAKTAATVDEMLQGVAEGRNVEGSQASEVTEKYIKNLTVDIASTLSVGFTDIQDPTLAQHSLNVAILAMAVGIEMGFDQANVALLGITGLVQDVGMALVPKKIRQARRPLTEIEFLEIQKHPATSANVLERMSGIPDIVRLVAYQSHERPDGSGYPRGRDKKSIHPFARILLVADSYAAMTATRPHRPAMMPYAAMETLLRQAREWRVDPLVVRNLLHVLGLFPIGSHVTLSDGSVAKVLRSNGEDFTRPVVMRVQNSAGSSVDPTESAIVNLRGSDLEVIQALPTPGRREIGLPQNGALTA